MNEVFDKLAAEGRLRVPPDRIWGDDDEEFWQALDGVQEAAYNTFKHPRDRLGRWINVPDVPVAPSVKSITTYQDAERVIESLGIKADLKPDPTATHQPDAAYYQQIAQAVTDITKKFPVLLDPKATRRLGEVRFLHKNDQAQMSEHLDAITGPDPQSYGTWGQPVGFAHGKTQWGFVESPIVVGINQWSADFGISDPVERGKLIDLSYGAPGSETTYGMMVHELGHAVDTASGLEFSQGTSRYSSAERGLLLKADLSPKVIKRFSEYGTSDPFEGFAETFEVLNTPGALDRVDPDLRQTLLKARDTINASWPTKLL